MKHYEQWIVKGVAGTNNRVLLANAAGQLTPLAEGVYGQFLMQGNGGTPVWATLGVPSHTHAISEVTGLQTALDSKALASHTHAISGVVGLQSALDSKAALGHGHTISEIANLQTTLDGKAAVSHNHDSAYAALSHNHGGIYAPYDHHHSGTYSPVGHNHDSAYAALSHGHQMSEIANLQAELGDIWDAILALQQQGGGDGGILDIDMPGEFVVSIINRVATISWAAVSNKTFLGGPSGAGPGGTPSFRYIDASDLP